MTKAHPDRPCFQCSGALMGKGCAVKTRPDCDIFPGKERRCFLAVPHGQEGNRTCLMGAMEYPEPLLFQFPGAELGRLLLPMENPLDSRLMEPLESGPKARDARYV